MMIKSKFTSLLTLGIACAGFTLVSGHFNSAAAQTRDPFAKAPYATQHPAGSPAPTSGATATAKPKPTTPPPPAALNAPPVESRIAYYKMEREKAAANGLELPKVTSVLTLDELSVTGIFRTPRGYAAMVEAKPIKLTYTIYPGEKFFDGQLVAVEENRLVFRKITKMSNNKFISAVENKTLQQYSVEQEVQGTVPVVTDKKEEQAAGAPTTPKDSPTATTSPSMVISPLEEMNRQPKEEPAKTGKEKSPKNAKKPVKVAKSKKTEDQK